MTTAQKAALALRQLGDTPGEIAANLKGAGFKGVPGNGRECPCGVCLTEHFGTPIHVTMERVVATEEDPMLIYFEPLPPNAARIAAPVSAFIRRFDLGVYSSLVKKGGA